MEEEKGIRFSISSARKALSTVVARAGNWLNPPDRMVKREAFVEGKNPWSSALTEYTIFDMTLPANCTMIAFPQGGQQLRLCGLLIDGEVKEVSTTQIQAGSSFTYSEPLGLQGNFIPRTVIWGKMIFHDYKLLESNSGVMNATIDLYSTQGIL